LTDVSSRPRTPTPRRRRSRADLVVRFIGIIGRVFVAAGLLLLFFTGYLLWGTGVYTKQEQARLKAEIAGEEHVTDKEIGPGGKLPPARPKKQPKASEALFSLKIPQIGVDEVVVYEVGLEQLKKGPGLFPDCDVATGEDCVADGKYPGEKGNVAISGHRTTYDAPFWNLNELKKGDAVDFESRGIRYRYLVREQKIVDPRAGYEVVEQHGRDEVTLTTCHPRFSAAQRLVIQADYQGATRIGGPGGTGSGGGSTAEQPVIPPDVLVLGSVALAAALGSLAMSKKYRLTAAWIALTIVGASGLWVAAFPRIVSLMPSNY
jgi:sortase A